MLDRLTVHDFEDHVGEEYVISIATDTNVPVVLTEARAVGVQALGESARMPFSLVFDTRVPGRLEQRTYAVTFPDGQSVEMFLVPIASTKEGGTRLEAVFT